jgi:hypothetical protein
MTTRFTIGQARKALLAAGYSVHGSYLKPGQKRSQRRYVITAPNGEKGEAESSRLKQIALNLASRQ